MTGSNPNVLFINLPTLPLENIQNIFTNKNKLYLPLSMPMGILYLSAVLKQKAWVGEIRLGEVGIVNYQSELLNLRHYKSLDDFIRTPAEKITFSPDIISVTLTFACTYGFFERCVGQLKAIWPGSIVIVGGVQATNCTKQLMENPSVDYTLRGEGELTLPVFVEKVSGKSPVKIKGIYSKRNYVPGMSLEICDSVTDLDEIPFPDWELIDMEQYSRRGMKKNIGCSDDGDKIATIITSRGCPFHCTFCASHTTHGRTMRYRSIENITREVEALAERYGINLIDPEDDLFTANKQRTIGLLRALKSLNIPDFKLQLPTSISINTTDAEMVDALVGSGLTVANLALESGSEYTQKNIIKKHVDLKKCRGLVEHLRACGNVTIRVTVILGFPKETKELMEESLEYAKSLQADWYVLVVAAPLPGSDMYKEFVEMGCIKDHPDTWEKVHFLNRFFDTPEISATELNDFIYRANLRMNFVDNYNFVSGNYGKAAEHFKDVLHNHPWHIIALDRLYECYLRMGNKELAEQTHRDFREMIRTDSRSKEMYDKYYLGALGELRNE